MAKEPKDDGKKQEIIIKRVKKVSGGHHGGAWKVAYADFVTAMMAFFLLLWLLSTTTEEQKKKIADYFSPTDPRISQSESGAGGVMGGTTISEEGAMSETTANAVDSDSTSEENKRQKADDETDKQDEKTFKTLEEEIKQAIENSPELKEFINNLIIDMTPEGLRIQIVDQDGKPMFELGSPTPLPQTVKILTVVAGVIKDAPNKVSVRGHTDSKPYNKDASYGNWELSSDRANASRRILLTGGLETARVENVQGKADREPLDPNDPSAARNRRISIILLKQSLVAGAKRAEDKFKNRKPGAAKPEPKKREEGVIYFP